MESSSSGSQSSSSSNITEPEDLDEEKKYIKALEHVAKIRTLTFQEFLYFGPNGAVAKMGNPMLRTEVAVKVEPFRDASVIDTWSKMNHINILPLIETIPIESFMYKGHRCSWTAYLMPYCSTTLAKQSFSSKFRESPGAFETSIDWIKQVLQGVAYMHQKGFYHLDIKEDNVLLNVNGRAVIADFTFATTKPFIDKSYIGCPVPYKPPEIIVFPDLKLHSEEVDMWALTILVINILTSGKTYKYIPEFEKDMFGGWLKHLRPFLLTLKNRYKDFVHLLHDSYPNHTFTEYENTMSWDFVRNLVQEEPFKRPKAVDLLKHVFVSYCSTETFLKRISMQYLGACENCATLISLPSWQISSDLHKFTDCLHSEKEDVMIQHLTTEKLLQELNVY